MAAISLIDPYSQQREEIARRQRMAQALQDQGSQVLEMPTTPGVTISPYAGLAKILQTGIGAYQEKKARDDYTKLQNEYRTNYNKQFGDLARAISAPAQEAFAGQEAIQAQPAQMAPKIEQGFGGYGMQREVGQFETAPAVEGRAAIPARPAVPAGYISPETLKGFDIPEVQQLAMAKYLAQFEPKAPIKGSPGDVFFDPTTGKERFKVPAAAGSTTLSSLGKLQAEREALIKTNPQDPRIAELTAAIAKETKDVAAERLAWDQKVQAAKEKEPNYTYKEEVDPATGVKSLIKIDNKGVVSEVLNSAGTKVKTDLPPKQNPVAVKTTINGQNVTIYVDPSTLAGKQYPEQYTGIIKDLLEAQDLMKYQTDPRVIALVGSSLNKGAGLPTQEDVARYLLDFDKTKVEMAYNNLKLNVGPSLKEAPNVLTGQSSSGAATNALPLPKDKDKKKLINGQTYQTDQGPAKWDAASGQFVN